MKNLIVLLCLAGLANTAMAEESTESFWGSVDTFLDKVNQATDKVSQTSQKINTSVNNIQQAKDNIENIDQPPAEQSDAADPQVKPLPN